MKLLISFLIYGSAIAQPMPKTPEQIAFEAKVVQYNCQRLTGKPCPTPTPSPSPTPHH